MSDPKLISPMLDNFAMGDPISDHNGVRCCPAMEKDSDDKYIVKIISIPASQTQLDALLLSGAFSSVESADGYFKSLADDVLHEVALLDKLSRLEGFVPFTHWQLQPMEDQTGYDIYLLSPYRNTLAHKLRHGSMTHLAALNLALDICAALLVCRRAGYLYVDLKPENIYLEEGKSSKIGDIGFINLNSLRFASLPDRYRSAYTAPEIADAYSSVNTTVDVYALGLILYQVFNDGILPPTEQDELSVFPPPAYADYEMAEIILKACNPIPSERWKDPVEMGQALVSYMQRNGAHDTPVVPVPEIQTADNEVDDVSDSLPVDESEKSTDNIADEDCTATDATNCEVASQKEASVDDDPADKTEPTIDTQEDQTEAVDEAADNAVSDQSITDFDNTNDSDVQTEPEELDCEAETPSSDEDSDAVIDETLPEQSDDAIDYDEVSEEVSDILQQADDLISHQTPDPVIPPDPIDIPIPPPLTPEPEISVEAEDVIPEDAAAHEDSQSEESGEDVEPNTTEEDEEEVHTKRIHWFRNLAVALVVLAIASVGLLFYTRYYLQPIDSIVLQEHENGDLTVLISSPVDESKLTVICSDTYGNQLSRPVAGGKADFTGLSPNSAYTIKIIINGFHKLTGDTSAAFTTPPQTNIVQFKAITGNEDGSVILSFTIDGPDSEQWQVRYQASGIPEQVATFTGHMHTLTGLTVGADYTFVLSPVTNLNYIGETSLQFTASAIVKAKDLRITSCLNNTLNAVWAVQEGMQVEKWAVRCYNDSGYDQTIVVNETVAAFEGIDSASAYTVEVTADGMSISERAYAAANSITITDFKMDESNANQLVLTWNSNGRAPANGWLILYTVDGSVTQEVTGVTGDTATISPKIPGATYTFTLQASDGSAILNSELTVKTSEAKSFSGYRVTAKNMTFKMCKRPSKKNWDKGDLSSSDYTSTFKSGVKASFLVRMNRDYNPSKDSITTLYVIRDENGSVVSTSTTTTTWRKMWYNNYCELDIPAIPQAAGKYTISVYFNGALAHAQSFKVTA